MAGETENLVLGLLRGMRAEMDKRFTALEARSTTIDDRLGGIEGRIEAVETQFEGIRYILVASVGSLVTDVKDHGARIAAPEGTPA